MNRPSEKQLEAIIRLVNTDDFKVFLSWVAESRVTEAIDAVEMDKEPKRSWMQGRVQQLGYMLGAIKDAEKTLEGVLRERGR